ncbi:type I-B CRISPR-associated protein Cas5 [Bacillaceae bacterium SAS-127]|nr:type I-B CRISPR-associated protein Cas5 [Bacillaceae bacterium SAS-127]
MKRAIAFELSGETAFFKKPDVNANVYFTYSHIPKVALLGMLGAILGHGGYHEQNRSIRAEGETESNVFPEFYEQLQGLHISIVPHGDRGYFPRKIQVFNNGVGYASNEAGNNLIVKEQWLEKPHWTIYILDEGNDEFNQLSDFLLTHQAVYLPYLGKNDHPANISRVREVMLTEVDQVTRIDSLFQPEDVQLGGFARGERNMHYYKELLPFGLEAKLNSYVFLEMMHTNRQVKQILQPENFFQAEDRCIAFY